MIVAGGGVRYSSAEADLADLAERWAIPVAETQAGKGTLPWDHPMNLGPMGATGGLAANRYAAGADVVIAVGTRLGDFTTASWSAWPADARFACINVDAADAAKARGLPVVADARQALRALCERLEAADTPADAERRRAVDGLRSDWNSAVDYELSRQAEGGALTQAQVIGAVNQSAGATGTVVNAAGSMPGDLHKLWRSANADDYDVEYGYSCMGYEIPGGLGIKLANPTRRVHVLIGDGSYLMLNSEVVTSIQERLPLTIVLVDTHGYRSISSLAASMGARNEFNLSSTPVDFVAHAGSMGARASRAANLDELRTALADARAADRTHVIVVEVDSDVRVPGYDSWWDVPVAEISSSPTVRAARKEYDQNLKRQSIR
jgi:3D-(3,5/4)-trihydroxycyclohexane-1,2-dione acylhydrolase (decyclizing)